MSFDISEIKNLSTEEKLRIIDEPWNSIDENELPDEEFEAEESPEVIAMLEERMAKYERGEGKLYTEQEARQILKAGLEEFRNSKKND